MAARPSPIVEEIIKKVKERVRWSGYRKTDVEKAIAKMLGTIDAVRLHYLENCVGCAACAPACPYYYVDEHYSPVNKAEYTRGIYRKKMTIAGRILGPLVGAWLPKSEKDLDHIAELVYRCTNCGNCYYVCPFGIDSGALVQGMLKIVATHTGRVPTILEVFAEIELREAYLEIEGLMMPWNMVMKKAEEMIGKPLPYDKKGAEVLLLPWLSDTMFYPGGVVGAIATMEAAGVDYTLPSRPWAMRPPIGAVVGRSEYVKPVLERVVRRIEELGVKKVVLLDGGFPYPWLRWQAPKVLGKRFNFQVLHFVEYVLELVKEGKLPYEPDDTPVTWHDPCQLGRRGGVTEEPYELLSKLSKNFRPLKHRGVHSICCGGGGGIGCLNREEITQMAQALGVPPEMMYESEKERRFVEETERAWAIAVRRKIEEIRESGAKVVVTACPVCIHSIAGGAKLYNLAVDVKHIAEYVGERVKLRR